MDDDAKVCPQCAETVKGGARLCRFCGYDFTPQSAAAPAQKKPSGKKAIGCLATVGVILMVVTCTAKLAEPGSRLASSPLGVDTQLTKIHDKVAGDAVKQYKMTAAGGTAIDRCAQAGMVAAAFLQAQDQREYDRWKATERSDCRAAGMPQ